MLSRGAARYFGVNATVHAGCDNAAGTHLRSVDHTRPIALAFLPLKMAGKGRNVRSKSRVRSYREIGKVLRQDMRVKVNHKLLSSPFPSVFGGCHVFSLF